MHPRQPERNRSPGYTRGSDSRGGRRAGHIDIVDVFRRPELTEDVAREAVAIGAGALWLQLGVVNWEAARIAAEGGLAVVMDRCTAIELRRLPRPAPGRTDRR